jgi:hypothetical protein
MMRCYGCGRRLLRAAATVTTADGTGHAGPTCARKLGLLAPKVARPRLFELAPRKRKVESGQMELVT